MGVMAERRAALRAIAMETRTPARFFARRCRQTLTLSLATLARNACLHVVAISIAPHYL